MRGRARQNGFSLVEVLVTTVVFSLGILGVTGLSAFSQRSTYESAQRSTASQLAYSLMQDMRFNDAALAVYLAAGTLGGGSRGAEPVPNCNDPLIPCTPAQFAAHSLWEIERMLDTGLETSLGVGTGGLVAPNACITGPAAGAAGSYTVTIVWRGVTELTDPGLNNCGTGTGLYGPADNFRRMVVVQSFIDPTI